jgi:hypothetical protein
MGVFDSAWYAGTIEPTSGRDRPGVQFCRSADADADDTYAATAASVNASIPANCPASSSSNS